MVWGRRGPGAAVQQEGEQDGENTGWAVPEKPEHVEQLKGEGTGAAEMQEGERERRDTGWAVPEESGAAELRRGGSGAAAVHM